MAFFPIGGSFRGRDDDLFVPSEKQIKEQEKDKEIVRLKAENEKLKKLLEQIRRLWSSQPTGRNYWLRLTLEKENTNAHS